MKITIWGEPPRATAQQKGAFTNPKTGRIVFFKKAKQRIEEESLIRVLRMKKPQGFVPMTGALRFTLKLIWPYRKTEKKSIVRVGEEVPMPVAPDFDNLGKMPCDAITEAGFWTKDAQVSVGKIMKGWGPVPYLSFTIGPDDGSDLREYGIPQRTNETL